MTVRIAVDILEADADTGVATVDVIADAEVQDMISGDSLGRLAVGIESAVKDALNDRTRVLRWNLDGGPVFHSLVETNDHVDLTESHSRVPRQVTVSGRGLEAQFEDVRVQQWPGMEQVDEYDVRHFNYASPGKCEEINGSVYDHGPVLDYDSNGQANQPDRPPPTTWRDTEAKRIWTRAFTLDMPGGTSLMRTTITPGDDVVLRQHGTADDRLLVWVGGVPVLTGPDAPAWVWGDVWPSLTLLQAGVTYDIVVRCENEYTVPGGSAAWLALSGWLLPDQASPLDPSLLAFHTETTGWYGLELLDDPTPGWTDPEIVSVFLAEWQAANQLTGWVVVDMAAEVDAEWTPSQEKTFTVDKQTGLDVLRSLDAEIAVEVVDGAKRLLMFPPGTRGDYVTGATGPMSSKVMARSYRWVDE